jgi:hypothetical protein
MKLSDLKICHLKQLDQREQTFMKDLFSILFHQENSDPYHLKAKQLCKVIETMMKTKEQRNKAVLLGGKLLMLDKKNSPHVIAKSLSKVQHY